MRRLLLCGLLVLAWPSVAAEALSIKGIRLGQSVAEACAGAVPDPPIDAETLRPIPGYVYQLKTECRVPVQSFAGQPVKDGLALVVGMRGKVSFVRVFMEPLSQSELVELGAAMVLAYGKATARRTPGAHLKMQWGQGLDRLELIAFSDEPDSLHRPWITLENSRDMAEVRALDVRNAKAIERHLKNLEAELLVLKAGRHASDVR